MTEHVKIFRVLQQVGDSEPKWLHSRRTPSGVYFELHRAKNARAQMLSSYWSYDRNRDQSRPTRCTTVQQLFADGKDQFVWYDVDVKMD